jgi:hypothetical protein
MVCVELARTGPKPVNRLRQYVGTILSYNGLPQVNRDNNSGSWRLGRGDQCAELHARKCGGRGGFTDKITDF